MPFRILILALILTTLAPADQIRLETGERLTGHLIDFQAGFVTLGLPESGGSAVRRVSPDEIQALHFEDEGADLETQALRRAQFLPLLTIEDTTLLIRYLETLVEAGEAAKSLRLSKLWHHKNAHPALDPEFRSLLIKSSLATDQPEEAIEHARAWLQVSPPPLDYVLPWQTMAQHQLDNGETKAALWTSLTPIAHAQAQSSKALQPLHELVAKAYHELGYDEHAAAHQSPVATALLTIPTPLHLSP